MVLMTKAPHAKQGPMISQADTNYPRPQLRRRDWKCLNGEWRFLFDPELRHASPNEIVEWPTVIRVPYCPESELSGIHDTGFHKCCWYERDFEWSWTEGRRTLLHFGAVDFACCVWVNGSFVGKHEGGFSSFYFDVTAYLQRDSNEQRVTVQAIDDPADLSQPRGKQDWQLEPHSIWYPRTTGIWQTVWVEDVPETYLDRIHWTPHLERWEIGCEVFLGGRKGPGQFKVRVNLSANGHLLVGDEYRVLLGEVHRRIALSDPGIDDYRNELLWSPEKPTLIEAEVELWDGDRCLDRVQSYTALRSVSTRKDRFMLNGRPYYLRLVLDQGYWPDGLMTAPDKDAHRRDIELTKKMGFNGVRKHQKIEDPIFLYWADVLGLLVWEEMPSAYRFTHDGVEKITREWIEIIDRDRNHPCIAVWVPFNESWGVPDLAEKKAHQNCVLALYHLTRTMDASRPVIGNDGWESAATDIVGIHDYDENPDRLAQRYSAAIQPGDLLTRRQPAGRVLTIDGFPHAGQPIMLTEFGGIAHARNLEADARAWGYSVSRSESDLRARYQRLMTAVNSIEIFSGFCYTQLTDTFQEANGLLYADRTPKLPLDFIATTTRGRELNRDQPPTLPVIRTEAERVIEASDLSGATEVGRERVPPDV